LARLTGHLPLIPIGAIAVLYFALLTILIGSLASAEERQMGTLEWQSLLPIAGWRQWLIKTGVVFALVLLLGIVLPTIVMGGGQSYSIPLAAFIVFVTTISLYVSSVSTSGVRAMVMTLPGMAALLLFVQIVVAVIERVLGLPVREYLFDTHVLDISVVLACFIALILRYAYRNHRSSERSAKRLLTQASGLAAYLVLALLVIALL
jgi:hypothetical protein